MSTGPIVMMYRRAFEAVNAQDLDATVSAAAPDIHYQETTLGWDLHSKDELRAAYAAWVDCARTHVDCLDSFEAGQRAALHWRYTGLITAAMPGVWPDSAVGRRFSFVGTSLVRVNDQGLVAHVTETWNLAALLHQLGGQLPS
ncbi:nuclear transport factor 2 family protein [Kitasatospora sp. NPDC101183]|uniref:nuclear transport factor 2 family protein n=1 Tax=Kitasatospora sp. NPDC101183 TaxID=3364100 RepID=UPI00381ABC4E